MRAAAAAVSAVLAAVGLAAGQEVTAIPVDAVQLRVEAPDTVAAGRPVPMRLVVENTSTSAVMLELPGEPVAFDLEVTDPAGKVLWRRMEGEVVRMILQVQTLEAGERLVFDAVWDQRTNAGRQVPPGVYRVRGVLPGSAGEPRRSPWVEFRIGS